VVISAWIAAAAAVLAAVIGPLVSLYLLKRQNEAADAIARMQINASLVPTSRQAWIDKLRDSIAELQSVLRTIGARVPHGPEDMQRMDRALLLRARLALLVNPFEADHKQLMLLLDRALGLAYVEGQDARMELVHIQSGITGVAQAVLRREWIRAKEGESVRPALPKGQQ
jgi:hypothetical protein